MSQRDGDTLPLPDSQVRMPRAHSASLVLALEYGRPMAGSLAMSLDGIDEVIIGRAVDGERVVERQSAPGAATVLTVRVPDPWMSRQHARLARSGATWAIADLGSKNGFVVDGAECDAALLPATARIEIGQTLFWFSEEGATVRPGLPGLPLPGVTTFHARFGQELEELGRVAPTGIPVLLLGESGTGKEVVARALHAASGRKGAFVAVNCASIPATLIESELFGYRKGAFSGASEDRLGLIRSAHGGTLLLDEIGELTAAGQAVLLRVLQERVVTPVGDVRPVEIDVRFVAATNRDLPALVSAGKFRGDLYARLLGLSVRLPPLRERPEDLGQLVATLLPEVAARPGSITFSKGAARALFAHPWPFNVRELERCLETAAALSDDGVIRAEHLRTLEAGSAAVPAASEATHEPVDADKPLDAEESARRDAIRELLETHRGNVAAVARALAKAPAQIHRWMKRYRLRPEDYRG